MGSGAQTFRSTTMIWAITVLALKFNVSKGREHKNSSHAHFNDKMKR